MSDHRLAFLGPPGTFSEVAARLCAPAANLVAAPSITAATALVTAGRADEAIVPIENSLEGAVTETLDLLIHALELRIRREIVLPVEHCLIGRRGTDPAAVATVYSHPQALAQCRSYLEQEFPQARRVAALSTVQAVELALDDPRAVAIAPRRAAALHDAVLHDAVVLAAGIQDDPRNSTRFVVLGADDAPSSGDDKTSMAFNVVDRAGALLDILQPFADAGINLTKIESRPARETLGVYVFLLDCAGHRLDPRVAAVLEATAANTTWFKILGSYQCYREG